MKSIGTIKLPPHVAAQLTDEAARVGQSVHALVRMMVVEGLEVRAERRAKVAQWVAQAQAAEG